MIQGGMIAATEPPQDTPATPPQPASEHPTAERRIKARTAYVQGKGSLRKIAVLTGLAFSTLRDWSAAEGWPELRDEYEKRQLARLIGPEPPSQNPPQVTSPQGPNAAQVQRLEKRMKEIEEQMDGMTNATTLQRLAVAHSKLFSAWQVLTGTPNPGARKVPRAGRALPPTANPVEPVETPQA